MGISGTATIAAGQTGTHLAVTILRNAVAGATKTFVLNITSPSSANIERATGVGPVLNWTAQ